jgi:hypothetical protein
VGADARILIWDDHDDFGGHAKRNGFDLRGKIQLSRIPARPRIMGFTAAGYADGGSYKFHFPDGDASIARLLVAVD